MENVRAHLLVSGRVQGVCFRAETRHAACRVGVTGWVRNLFDGRVEIVAEGRKDLVDALVTWCRKGPPGAKVEDAMLSWEPYAGEFKDFLITR